MPGKRHQGKTFWLLHDVAADYAGEMADTSAPLTVIRKVRRMLVCATPDGREVTVQPGDLARVPPDEQKKIDEGSAA
jgi:hypothetical protein